MGKFSYSIVLGSIGLLLGFFLSNELAENKEQVPLLSDSQETFVPNTEKLLKEAERRPSASVGTLFAQYADAVKGLERIPLSELAHVFESTLAEVMVQSPEALTEGKSDLLELVVIRWISSDIESAWNYMSSTSLLGAYPAMRETLMERVLLAWEQHDLEGLLARAEVESNTNRQGYLLQYAIQALGKQDPLRAIQLQEKQRGEEALDYSLFALWAERDFEAAFRYANTLSRSDQQSEALSFLFASVNEANVEAALALALSVESSEMRNDSLYSLFKYLSVENPGLAFQKIKTLPPAEIETHAYAEIFTHWAQQNPHEAFVQLESLDLLEARESAIPLLFTEWAQIDASQAMQFAQKLSLHAESDAALASVFSIWVDMNPQEAAASALKILEGGMREQVLEQVFTELAQQSPQQAMQWLTDSVSVEESQKLIQGATWSLANDDPELLQEFLGEVSNRSVREEILSALASRFKNSNTQAALAWVDTLPNENNERNYALEKIVGQWAYYEPELAADYLAQNQDSVNGETIRLAEITAAELAKYDHIASLEWAYSLPNEAMRDRAALGAITHWANVAPEAAWAYTQQWPAGSARERIASQVVEAWAERNPDSLAVAYEQSAPGAFPVEAVELVVKKWIDDDITAATSWVEQLPVGAARDQGLRVLASNDLRKNPQSALKWVETISEIESQESTALQLFQDWSQYDPEAALQALANARLPSEVKAVVREKF